MAARATEVQAELAQFQQLLTALQAEVNGLRNQNNDLNANFALLQAENQRLIHNVAAAAAQQQAAAAQAAAAANVAAAAAGAVGGAAPGGAVVPPPPAPAVFAATPAMANHEQLINYQVKSGVMVYEEGCKALTAPVDMKSKGTVVYITELQAKCIKMGWSTGTQQITHFTNAAGVVINVIGQWCGARLRGPKSNGVNDGRTAVLYHFSTCDELEEMRQSATTHKNRQKHRNHGGRAAFHSSDVELMDQRDPTCGRPVHAVGRGRGRRIMVVNHKI
jgi:hypothetical protein